MLTFTSLQYHRRSIHKHTHEDRILYTECFEEKWRRFLQMKLTESPIGGLFLLTTSLVATTEFHCPEEHKNLPSLFLFKSNEFL